MQSSISGGADQSHFPGSGKSRAELDQFHVAVRVSLGQPLTAPSIASGVARRPVTCSMLIR
jgi:hypothetical protein